jgi:creatinine amidohydrolase
MLLSQADAVRYELLRPAEVVEARRRAPVAFVPVGPLEWHGPHLPLGTDGLHAWHVSLRVALEAGGVVLPPLFAGIDSLRVAGTAPEGLDSLGLPPDARVVGMDFPGFPVRSTYYDESVFGLVVRDVVRALLGDGYRLIVLANGHGAAGQQRTLNRVALEESRPGEARVVHANVWVAPEPPSLDPGHAERQETAVMLALEPGRVALGALPVDGRLRYREFGIVDGPAFDGSPTSDFTVRPEADPRAATAEEGEQILGREVKALAERVRAELVGTT